MFLIKSLCLSLQKLIGCLFSQMNVEMRGEIINKLQALILCEGEAAGKFSFIRK